jgi:toxin ParE1/3/4
MVIWTRPAKADLRSIYDYIARDSRFYAKRVVHDIREKTDLLERTPRIGKKVPELEDPQIRELSIYSYRIIYEIQDGRIVVLAVVHKRRDLRPSQIARQRGL